MKRRVGRALPYLVAVGIVALLLWQIDPRQVVQLLIGVDPGWLLAGFGCYVLTNVLRAYRFGVLLGAGREDGAVRTGTQAHQDASAPQPAQPSRHQSTNLPIYQSTNLPIYQPTNLPICQSTKLPIYQSTNRPLLSPWHLLPEMFALSLLNNTLPSRGGELSFPYFMRHRHGTSVGESSAALVVARIFDYLAVALLYILFALLNRQRLEERAATAVTIVAGLVLVSLLVLATAPWLGRQGVLLAHRVTTRLGWAERRWGRLLLRGGDQAIEMLGRMRSGRIYALTAILSLLTWLGVFGWFAAFMQGISLPQPFPLIIVGATFAMLAKAIPFITIGGFGAHEAGWVVGFSLVGMVTDTAIASGFAVNILTLLTSAIFGGAALIWMRARDSRRSASFLPNDSTAPTLPATQPGEVEPP